MKPVVLRDTMCGCKVLGSVVIVFSTTGRRPLLAGRYWRQSRRALIWLKGEGGARRYLLGRKAETSS